MYYYTDPGDDRDTNPRVAGHQRGGSGRESATSSSARPEGCRPDADADAHPDAGADPSRRLSRRPSPPRSRRRPRRPSRPVAHPGADADPDARADAHAHPGADAPRGADAHGADPDPDARAAERGGCASILIAKFDDMGTDTLDDDEAPDGASFEVWLDDGDQAFDTATDSLVLGPRPRSVACSTRTPSPKVGLDVEVVVPDGYVGSDPISSSSISMPPSPAFNAEA